MIQTIAILWAVVPILEASVMNKKMKRMFQPGFSGCFIVMLLFCGAAARVLAGGISFRREPCVM